MNERRCRQIIRERSEGFCERCCRHGNLTLHHRQKRSQGGSWSPANCVLVCGHGTAGCHGWIEANPTFARAEGFALRRLANLSDSPIWWRHSTWVVLLADGGMQSV